MIDPKPTNVEYVQQLLDIVIGYCEANDVTATLELVPVAPLAMGRYKMTASVRSCLPVIRERMKQRAAEEAAAKLAGKPGRGK